MVLILCTCHCHPIIVSSSGIRVNPFGSCYSVSDPCSWRHYLIGYIRCQATSNCGPHNFIGILVHNIFNIGDRRFIIRWCILLSRYILVGLEITLISHLCLWHTTTVPMTTTTSKSRRTTPPTVPPMIEEASSCFIVGFNSVAGFSSITTLSSPVWLL